jgi:hypothetical protein
MHLVPPNKTAGLVRDIAIGGPVTSRRKLMQTEALRLSDGHRQALLFET